MPSDDAFIQTFLYVPDDSNLDQPMEKKTLSGPSPDKFYENVRRFLNCVETAEEPMFSPEYLAIFEGQEEGLPPGTQFTVYGATIDDNGNASRPYNSRAAKLLLRPKSYGPMLIVKAVCQATNWLGPYPL